MLVISEAGMSLLWDSTLFITLAIISATGNHCSESCFLEQIFELGHRDFVSSEDVCWRPGKKVFMTEF
jgi:hypothetical protein